MLNNRIKQFREYNKTPIKLLAELLNITEEQYENLESGKQPADINTIKKLSIYYKVTVDEFYGYSPRLALNAEKKVFDDNSNVPDFILKMADLSWDETQIILHYREHGDKDEIIKQILNRE